MGKIRTVVLIAFAAASLTFTATAHAQCTRCCFPSSNVTVSPTTAQEGQSVIVTTVLLNCSPDPRVLTATVNVTPENAACTAFAEAFKASAYILPYRSRTVSYTFAAPHCRGAYSITEKSSNTPGYATATLTVN
jgi:hypothetical protein